MAIVPYAAQQSGQTQFLSMVSSYGLLGFGQAMMGGAREAWVVDNLIMAKRRELISDYFARISSFASLGAVAAGIIALALLMTLPVSRKILDGLWYIAAFGMMLCVFIQLTIKEYRPALNSNEISAVPSWRGTFIQGLKVLCHSKKLMFFASALIVASFPESACDDAFDMSLIDSVIIWTHCHGPQDSFTKSITTWKRLVSWLL